MKKNYYRISMMEGADESFCKYLIIAAAKSNGGDYLPLEKIKEYGDSQKLLFDSLYKDTTCIIVGDTVLHVDRKINEEFKTVMVIEEIEVFDLNEIPETVDEEAIL